MLPENSKIFFRRNCNLNYIYSLKLYIITNITANNKLYKLFLGFVYKTVIVPKNNNVSMTLLK